MYEKITNKYKTNKKKRKIRRREEKEKSRLSPLDEASENKEYHTRYPKITQFRRPG